MAHAHDTHSAEEQPIAPAQTKAIWRTFWILLAITALEFLIAFQVSPEHKLTKAGIFIVMTIVKAFYIIGEFMHLKHEVKSLIWTILVPVLFVVWLIIALVYEGGLLYQWDRGV
jgi:cytochrome c oxidase subunit IV